MSRKIQVVVPDPIADEVDAVVKRERFSDQSEFVRSLIRDYLNRRDTKATTANGEGKSLMENSLNLLGESEAVGELG